MLEGTPIGALLTVLNDMMHWFDSIQFTPTFVVEISIGIIAIAISLTIFGLQLRADKKMNKVINRIESYTGRRKKIEVARKKFYIDRLRDTLEQIKKQNLKIKDTIEAFKRDPRNPNELEFEDLRQLKKELGHLCEHAEGYVDLIEPLSTYPQTLQEIMSSLPMWYDPLEALTREPYWMESRFRIDFAESTLNEYLPEIDKYIELLSKEEEATGVTDSNNQQPRIP